MNPRYQKSIIIGLIIARYSYSNMKLFKKTNSLIFQFLLLFILLVYSGCTKMVQVPEPINTITASETFSNDIYATSAIIGIYSKMSFNQNNQCFSNGSTTLYAGVSSDELSDIQGINDQFLHNDIQSNNGSLSGLFWQPAYFDIYMANAIIEGLGASKTVSQAAKNQILGEAKFIRAFCYFYLTNLFGDVPLELSTDALQTAILPRAPQSVIYQQIIADLQDAQNLLIQDYSLSNGEHIRANKWAATALLARVYLYLPQPNYSGADSAATAVINSGQFSLLSDLGGVFLKNSNEAILQLQTISTHPNYITFEGLYFVPRNNKTNPTYFLTNQLLGAFEYGDQRRLFWVDSTIFRGVTYYCPYKYKAGVTQENAGNITEYYTLLRFAEQYLIRAEAKTEEGQTTQAVDDLNVIRSRAGLAMLSTSLPKDSILLAVAQERRIELFAEWGHRWLDLKRWGTAVQTLDTITNKTGYINSNSLLFPIPASEIQLDPNLTQNPGY